jgi:predicted patatin/cPLA2 family phospholipase
MRGVVSAGMAAAIERLGLSGCFDLVVGTSAGALNGAALLAGVAEGSWNAYHSAMTTRRFINPWRLLIGRAAVDVAYTLDHAGDGLDAGRHERVAASRTPLHCLAVDVEDATGTVLSELHTVEDLRAGLLASSRMPWIGGAPVEFRGRRYLDGGLVESIPFRTALRLGATHVLVLQTRPWGSTPEPTSPLADRIICRRLRALNPALLSLYRRRSEHYEHAVAEIAAATRSPGHDGPYVCGLRLPEGGPTVGRLERRAGPLETAGRAALDHAERVIGNAMATPGRGGALAPGAGEHGGA